VQLGRLRRGIRRCVLARRHGVLGGDEDEAAANALLFHDAEGLPSDEEVSLRQYGVVLVPHLDARVLDGGAGGEAGVRYDDVYASVLENSAPVGAVHLVLVRHVGLCRDARLGEALCDLARPLFVEVADHHTGPA
jgi:hypothetical protein